MGRWGWVWVAGWAAASAAWCATAGRALGPTFDEPLHLRAGLGCWRAGSAWDLSQIGCMPLPVMTQTLPLYAAEVATGTRTDPVGDLHAWLPVARLGTLVFWVGLLVAGYVAGRAWAGPVGGWLAVPFLAVEPVLLGHASLAVTDLAVAACTVAACAGFKVGREKRWPRRIAIPAVLCGLAILAKASALVFVPITLCVVEAEHLWAVRRRGGGFPWRRSVLDLALIAAGGFVVAKLLFPQTDRTLHAQILHNAFGHGYVYLLGRTSETGFWYYFPTAFAAKVSLPLLLLPAVILLTRPRALLNAPLLSAAAILAVSPQFKVQLGVRLILAVVALAALGVGIAVARWLADLRSSVARRAAWALVVLCLGWTACRAVQVWPNGLSYTNELFGGTPRGYLALSESNYDWGQGLPELTRWADGHGVGEMDVWYYGTDPKADAPPFRRLDLSAVGSVEELRSLVRGRYLAVSTSHLCGAPSAGADVLRGLTPVDRTTTYLIFDLSGPK